MIKRFSIFICIFAISCVTFAQESPEPKQISGGILNGKAVSLPKPEYPAAARMDGVSGEVKIQVLIDEAGNVISAKAVGETRHAALRSAAESAALQAKFSPTTLSGSPVKVSGVITYNFEPVRYEDVVKPMALGMLLRFSAHLANHPETVKELFGGEEDIFLDTIKDFPQFKAELSALSKFETLTPKQRFEAAESAFASIKSRISEKDKWQFEVGQVLGDLFGVFAPYMNENAEAPGSAADLAKFESYVKTELFKLGSLTSKAPEDFPKPILNKLRALETEAAKDKLLTEDNFESFFRKVMALLETISPES